MGNKQSQPQANLTKANFTPDTEILSKTYDPHYGDIKVVRDFKTNETMILKEVVLNTKQAYDAEQAYFNTRVSVKHPNVVNVIGYNSHDKHNFCSTYYKVALYIEHFDDNLQTVLETRRAAKDPFTEGELLLIADDLITGLSYFQSQGFSHGDIRPFNIFVKDQVYKLSDPSLNAQKNSTALTHAIVHGTKTYLAPELIPQVPQQKFEITTDKYRADVYSLGVTLLSLATLTNSEDLYNYEKGTINENLIRERLDNVKQNYSQFTHDLIEDMLITQETNRPDSIAVSNKVGPHKEYMRRAFTGRTITVDSRTNIDPRTQSGEKVKRANLPTDDNSEYRTGTIEELEARIKAAIERTEETFKIVKSTPGLSSVFGTSKHTQPFNAQQETVTQQGVYTAQPSTYTQQGSYTAQPSTYTAQGTYTYSATPIVHTEVIREGTSQSQPQTERLAKSQVGQDIYNQYAYQSTEPICTEKPVKRNEERVVRGAIPTFDDEDSATANVVLRASGNQTQSQVQAQPTTTYVPDSTYSYEATKTSGVNVPASTYSYEATKTSGVHVPASTYSYEATKTSGVNVPASTYSYEATKTSGVNVPASTYSYEATKTSGVGATGTGNIDTTGLAGGNVNSGAGEYNYSYSTVTNYNTYTAQPTTSYSAQPTTTFEPKTDNAGTTTYSYQQTTTYEPTGSYYGIQTQSVEQGDQNGKVSAIDNLVNKFVDAVTSGEGGINAEGSFSDHLNQMTASQTQQATYTY